VDNLFFFALGLLAGSLFTWLISGMRARWKKSRDLRSAAAKAKKEKAEKDQKAKQDSHQATNTMFRAIVDGVLLVVGLLALVWVLWFMLTQ
jgi:hypothetical protein